MIRKSISFLLSLALILTLLLLSLLNCTPPVSRDALTHHLAIPKLYLLHGGIYEIPELVFSYYPMNLDLLYLLPLRFGFDHFPKFIHMAFGLGTAWLISRYLTPRLNATWGLLGALLFLTTPIVLHLATTAYVDLGVTFFTTASIYLALQWQREQKLKLLIGAGLCAGLAAGTKYNGLITIFLIASFIPFMGLRSSNSLTPLRTITCASLFLISALAILAPWLVRNFIWTSNPIYPLFDSFFNSSSVTSLDGSNPLLIRKIIYNEPIWQTLLIPIRIFFEGRDNNPQFFDGVLNPFILLFTLLVILPTKNDSQYSLEKHLFFWFAFLFILFSFTERVIRIRYIVPALPCLIILSTYGLNYFHNYILSKKYYRFFVWLPSLLVLIALAMNGNYFINYWFDIRPIQYISGQINRTQFITRFWPEYELIQYANNNLPASVTILAVFLGNRGYYFDRPVLFDLQSGKSLLSRTIQESSTAAHVANTLTDQGITHLLIRDDLFNQWIAGQLTPEQKKMASLFFLEHTQKIASTKSHRLLSIKSH